MSELTVEEVAVEMLRCKQDTWGRLTGIENELSAGEGRMDDIEASMSAIRAELHKHGVQRAMYNDEIKGELTELKSWFSQHDGKEMEKYDQIIAALKDLTITLNKTVIETDYNSSRLHAKEAQELTDAAVRSALAEAAAPFIEYRKKVILGLITAATAGVATLLWNVFKLGIQ